VNPARYCTGYWTGGIAPQGDVKPAAAPALFIDESKTAKGYTPAASVPAVYGQKRTIESITIHHWGATGQTHDGVVNFFVNGPGATSAHFVASAGRVHCLVSPQDAAWHAGNGKGNATSIGIECRPEATDADYKTVAQLVAWLRATYGNLPLVPHRYWQATACPGVWDLSRIDSLARAGGAVIGPAGEITKESDDMALTKADMQFLLNYPAYDGGPSISQVLKDTHLAWTPGESGKRDAGLGYAAIAPLQAAVNALAEKAGITPDELAAQVAAQLANGFVVNLNVQKKEEPK
jgi:hypothetical protein